MTRRRRFNRIQQLKSKDVPKLRESILLIQQGICPVCEKPIEEGTACLDHHHKKRVKGTGQIRGVLCRSCNVFIAKSENNCVRYGINPEDLPTVLRNVAHYLEKDQYPYMHPSEAPKKPKLMKSSYNKMLKWHKENGTTKRVAPYNPKTKYLTKPIARMFEMAGIEPEFHTVK